MLNPGKVGPVLVRYYILKTSIDLHYGSVLIKQKMSIRKANPNKITGYSSMALNPINIRWVRTGSQPH